jgi:hypothetical protein
MGLLIIIFLELKIYIFKLLVCFLNEHKEEARAPRTKTRHLNPSPWQSYSLNWRMRHALKKSVRNARRQSCERSVRQGPLSPEALFLKFLMKIVRTLRTQRPPRVPPWQYSVGHDAHKASTRRQHARLAYVMHVDDRASVAYAAASVRPGPCF